MNFELNPTNAFGEVLLDLIDAQYGGDYSTGIYALMQVTGYDEQTVAGIINGSLLVEDSGVLNALMGAFPDADEQDLSIVMTVASGVEEGDRAETEAILVEQYQERQAQGAAQQYEEGGDADYVGAGAGQGSADAGEFARRRHQAQANFAAQQQSAYLAGRVNQLENYVANFAAHSELSSTLDRLHQQASVMEAEGYLPPAYRRMLIGDFSSKEERVARFGQMARENGVDLSTMLFAAEYALGILGEGAKYVEFSDHSVSEEMLNVAQFSAGMDAVVAQDYDAIFNL
jgi:hypothetical protein